MNVQVFSLTVAVCLSLLIAPPCAGSGQISTTVPDAAVIASNAFAMDLYAALRKQEGNLFFSPANIACTLAMAEAGARGQTAQEIRDVLHMRKGSLAMHKAFGALGKSAPGGVLLYSANSIWAPKPIQLLEPFQTIMERAYGISSIMMPNPNDSRDIYGQINAWIAQQTNNRIESTILRSDIPSVPLNMFLVSASYMKGTWHTPFPRERTQPGAFTMASGNIIQVPTMHLDCRLGYAKKDGCQILSLPYSKSTLSMIIVLPNDPDGLPALEKEISQSDIKKWMPWLDTAKAKVSLPRFCLASNFELKKTLSDMGMPLAFCASADFGNITADCPWWIMLAKHCAWVDVNEEGTEAASATVLGYGMGPVPEEVDFIADHPFLLLIRDRDTGLIHYIGRVLDPTQN